MLVAVWSILKPKLIFDENLIDVSEIPGQV